MMADSNTEQSTPNHDDKDRIPADQDTPAEDHVLSLNDRQAVFSGRKIHLTPFHSVSDESLAGQPGAESPDTSEAPINEPGSTGQRSDTVLQSPWESTAPSRPEPVTDPPLDGERPFVFDFLSGSEQIEEPVDSFVAGLQSVFAVRDETGSNAEVSGESDAGGESSETMNPYAIEAGDDELYSDDGTLSPDEEYQQDERQREQESIDGMIRQNDADLLYELGEKYGPPGMERVGESPRARITPTSILEAMLFVGDRENHPLALKRATDLMRNVSEEEALASIESLNHRYEAN
ncbi:MAG: hypothetical protein PHQ75_12360, partial [Thermoguttaceae bacterium]|nr:hypothetical protein [Thermoguttaceae bacterium]